MSYTWVECLLFVGVYNGIHFYLGGWISLRMNSVLIRLVMEIESQLCIELRKVKNHPQENTTFTILHYKTYKKWTESKDKFNASIRIAS